MTFHFGHYAKIGQHVLNFRHCYFENFIRIRIELLWIVVIFFPVAIYGK